MIYKRCVVLLMLTVFLTTKAEPVFPYLKSLPQLARSLAIFLCTGKVNILVDLKIAVQDDQNGKADDKEGEKDAGKTVKEECKILFYHNHEAVLFTQSCSNSIQLYKCSKTRTHINDVFRPPLA